MQAAGPGRRADEHVERSASWRSKFGAIEGAKRKRPPTWRPFPTMFGIEPKSDEPERNLVAAAIGHEANAGEAQDHHGPSRSFGYRRSEVGVDVQG